MKRKHTYVFYMFILYTNLERNSLEILGLYHNIFRKLWNEKNFSIYLLQRSLWATNFFLVGIECNFSKLFVLHLI